jgi:hypothetical protein
LQLDFPACFLHITSLLFYFFYFYFEKSEFLGNNPELGYDSAITVRNFLCRHFNSAINIAKHFLTFEIRKHGGFPI